MAYPVPCCSPISADRAHWRGLPSLLGPLRLWRLVPGVSLVCWTFPLCPWGLGWGRYRPLPWLGPLLRSSCVVPPFTVLSVSVGGLVGIYRPSVGGFLPDCVEVRRDSSVFLGASSGGVAAGVPCNVLRFFPGGVAYLL